MEPRRLIACALAVELLAAGAVLVARLPRDGGADSLVAAPAAGDYLEAETSPLPEPTAVPSVTPVPRPSAVPPTPRVSLPPLPTVSVPPLPSVSLPPVPTVSLPPVPRVPGCPEDTGAGELPEADRSVDVGAEGATAVGPVSAGGRIWFSVIGGSGPHVVGVDPDGGRIAIPTKNHTHVVDVVGHLAYTVEHLEAAVVYDIRTGKEVRRWDRTSLSYDTGDTNVELSVAGVAADEAGLWVVGVGGAGEDYVWAVVRITNDTIAWSTRLPGPLPDGYTSARAEVVAERGGNVYVGANAIGAKPDGTGGRARFWRVAPDGTLAAQRTLDLVTTNSDMPMEAGPDGLYAAIRVGDHLDSEVARLDPADLRLLGSSRANTVQDLFLADGSVYTLGIWCSFLVSRYDAHSMKRTGFWRMGEDRQAMQGTVHEGRPWLLHTSDSELRAVALRRYELP